MCAETTINLFCSELLASVKPQGYLLALACKDGVPLARLAFADWLEENFVECLTLRYTLNELRN